MKYAFMSLVLIVQVGVAKAQYVLSGTIEYEKKVHTHAVMKDFGDDNNSWYERMKSQIPKFNITYFDLVFNGKQTLYKPGRESPTPTRAWGSDPASDNVVLTDLATHKVSAVKQIFEQKFLVQDTMRKMEWRLKNEIRTIAGFKCRKAVGIICDSVYVVAFYADDIPVSGGPEMFGNLPGMVLEVAIPRLHTTWVATKVRVKPPVEEDFRVKQKGKKVDAAEMFTSVMEGLKDWGKWGIRYVWMSVL